MPSRWQLRQTVTDVRNVPRGDITRPDLLSLSEYDTRHTEIASVILTLFPFISYYVDT